MLVTDLSTEAEGSLQVGGRLDQVLDQLEIYSKLQSQKEKSRIKKKLLAQRLSSPIINCTFRLITWLGSTGLGNLWQQPKGFRAETPEKVKAR